MPVGIPDSYLGGTAYVASGGASPDDPSAQAASNRQTVIDGTPARVAGIGLFALAVLIGLRWGGFKFNVTASN